MPQRDVRFIIKQTSVPGRVPSGTTGNESNFIKQSELALNLPDKKLWSFDGSDVFEIGSNSFLNLTGGTISFIEVSNSISAQTIYSGATDLSDLIGGGGGSGDVTRVQGGLNIYTAGTDNFPTINISGATLDNINVSGQSLFNTLTANAISGSTVFSGDSNLYEIFSVTGHSHEIGEIENLENRLSTKANLSGATFTGGIYSPNLSGGTIYSGNTDLYDIFATEEEIDVTRLQGGLNTYTAGTENFPSINVSAATLDNLYVSGNSEFNVLSAQTIYSGGNNIDTLFSLKSHSHEIGEIENLENRLGTKANLSGATFTGGIYSPNLSGGTLYSGGTDVETVIRNISEESEDITRLQEGLNTYTGGTDNFPQINVSGATLDNITSTGISRFNTVEIEDAGNWRTALSSSFTNRLDLASDSSFTEISISGKKLVEASGASSTEDYVVTSNQGYIQANTKATEGFVNATVSDSDGFALEDDFIWSANTGIQGYRDGDKGNFSYFTDPNTGKNYIYTAIEDDVWWRDEVGHVTRTQGGLNIYTGGTVDFPTINLSAATLDNLSVSGDNTSNSFSATTLSGGTIYSGNTDLYDIFKVKREYQASMVGEASNVVGLFARGSEIASTANPAGKPITSPFASFTNGGVEPFVIPSDCVLSKVGVVMAGAAVETGTVGAAPTLRISIYDVQYNSRTLKANIDIPLNDTSGIGMFNDTSGEAFQYASQTANISLSGGTLLGAQFTNQAGTNDGINALRRCMLYIETEE